MNDLHKAYQILGLEPGASLEAITRRYKRLIMVWHPDRFPTHDGKHDAEEELKRINDAQDRLKAHFSKGTHNPNGACACRPDMAQASRDPQPQPGGQYRHDGHGPGPGRKTADERQKEEEAARRRTEERRWQEETEAKRKAEEQTARAAAGQQQQAFQQAMKQQEAQDDSTLRWKISRTCGAAFGFFVVASLVAAGVEESIINAQKATMGLHESREEQSKHSDDWSNYITDRQHVASQLLGRHISTDEILDWHQPYSDPNGNTIAKAVFQKFNPPAIPNTTTYQLPNIDLHPTLTPNELSARISANESRLAEVDRVAKFGGYQNSDTVRELNRLRQQLDIDKTYLKSERQETSNSLFVPPAANPSNTSPTSPTSISPTSKLIDSDVLKTFGLGSGSRSITNPPMLTPSSTIDSLFKKYGLGSSTSPATPTSSSNP